MLLTTRLSSSSCCGRGRDHSSCDAGARASDVSTGRAATWCACRIRSASLVLPFIPPWFRPPLACPVRTRSAMRMRNEGCQPSNRPPNEGHDSPVGQARLAPETEQRHDAARTDEARSDDSAKSIATSPAGHWDLPHRFRHETRRTLLSTAEPETIVRRGWWREFGVVLADTAIVADSVRSMTRLEGLRTPRVRPRHGWFARPPRSGPASRGCAPRRGTEPIRSRRRAGSHGQMQPRPARGVRWSIRRPAR
jgi:hypothetical protein